MADFCKQCSLEVWGEDTKDFQFQAPDGMVTAVLCEECGPCYVTNDGTCVTPGCLKKHGEAMKKHHALVKFDYRNHRGELAQRTVAVGALEYINKPGYDYKSGWFLSGYCLDRKARRSFALANIVMPAGTEDNRCALRLSLMIDP